MKHPFLYAVILLFAITYAALLGKTTAYADVPANFSTAQHCATDHTVTLNLSWTGDPSSREVWVDYSSNGSDFGVGTSSSIGPLSGRAASEQLTGLTSNTVYWFRVNQLLPSGDWQSNVPYRYVLGCGNVAAPANSIRITGFGDGTSNKVGTNTTLRSCNPSKLWAYVSITGLTQITDVTYEWYQGNTRIAVVKSAFDPQTTDREVTLSFPSGNPSGPYRLEIWSGDDATWTPSVMARVDLTC